MKIIVAQNAGFCMGVKRAVELALAVSRTEPRGKVFTYGPLIHNPQTVSILQKRGVVQLDGLEELPADCSSATLIIRAHGISPAERAAIKSRGVKIVDATCPRVGRVQALVRKHSRLGYTVVIVGDSDHPEVRAISAYATGPVFTVGTTADARALPAGDKVCVVAQTTCSENDYQKIVGEIKSTFPAVEVFNTICDSTEKRQREVGALAREMDAIIVVGGKDSANTRRLAEIAATSGALSYHVETEDEVARLPSLAGCRVGVAAGASTPNWVLDKVVERLRQNLNAGTGLRRLPTRLFYFLVRSDVLSALGALVLCFVSAKFQALPLDFGGLIAAILFLFSMHTLYRTAGGDFHGGGSLRLGTYFGRETVFRLAAIVSLGVALLFAYLSGIPSFWFLLFLAAAGGLYGIPSRISQVMRRATIGKNVIVALAWALALVRLPVGENFLLAPQALLGVLLIFALVLARSLLSDTLEMKSDSLAGKTTLPIVWGKKTTISVVKSVLAGGALLLLLAATAAPLRLLLLLPFFYLWICSTLYVSRAAKIPVVVIEGLLEISYLFAGLYAVVS